VSTQLRLVEAPAGTAGASAGARRAPRARQTGRAVPRRTRRAVRWDDDWRLNAEVRRIGRAGVAAARASLGKATETSLLRAS
jgi:hypothetical protein